MAQIRRSKEAAEIFINEVNLERAEINALKEHETVILKKYKPIAKHEMILMTLQRGRFYIKHPVERLTQENVPEIAYLPNEVNFFSFIPDGIIERMRNEHQEKGETCFTRQRTNS